MRPYYKIEIEGVDKTKAFQGLVMSVQLTDTDGIKSDTCEILLRDNGDLEIPKADTKISISMGVAGRGLIHMGRFLLSGPDLSPGTMRLKGKSAPFRPDFSSPKEKSWDDKSYGDIVKEIATSHQLKAAVESSLFDKIYSGVYQTESDKSFLTHIAMISGCVFKVQNGYLVMSKKDSSESVFGKSLPVIRIKNPQNWNYKEAMNDQYTGVKSYYKNPDEKGKRLETLTGSSEKIFELIQTWDDLRQATDKPKAKLLQLQKSRRTLSITKSTDENFYSPELASGQTSIIEGVRKGIDGKWKVKKVIHKFTNESLSVSADFEKII